MRHDIVVKLCTKFEWNWTIRGWIINDLADFRRCYVVLWPWPLNPWPWTFIVHRMSRVRTLNKIWAKSNNPRLNYWRFGTSPCNVKNDHQLPDGSQVWGNAGVWGVRTNAPKTSAPGQMPARTKAFPTNAPWLTGSFTNFHTDTSLTQTAVTPVI